MRGSKIIFFLLLFLILNCAISAQVVNHYDLRVAGIKCGFLVATKYEKNEYTFYSLVSEANVWLVKNISVRYHIKSVYYKGILLRTEIVNESSQGKYYSSIVWNQDHYDINIKTNKYEKVATEYRPITFNITRLYFDEPENINEIFADNTGVFAPLIKTENSLYKLQLPEKQNIFIYVDKTMIRAELASSFRNFTLEKK